MMRSPRRLVLMAGLGFVSAGAMRADGNPSSIDPLYSAVETTPAADERGDATPWIYADTGLETYLLSRLRWRSAEVCAHVGYPGIYAEPARAVSFRLRAERVPETIVCRAVGRAEVSVEGRRVCEARDAGEPFTVAIPRDLAGKPGLLTIRLTATAGDAPALLIEEGPCATGGGAWESSVDENAWTAARPVAQTRSGVEPHRAGLPVVELAPERAENGLLDFGRTILARVVFSAEGEPSLAVGESPAEALSGDPAASEQRTTLERTVDGRWRSRFPLAFRYARITGEDVADVKAEAVFYPVRYRGDFACSDERLTKIWMNSAFTLRSCMNELMLDGIKRDRLPWMGDQAINLAANAYVFAEPEVLRRTFTALGAGDIRRSDINGIVDYSLWSAINQDRFQLYFDDPAYLRREWPRVRSLIEFMETRCDADGFLAPRPGTWMFIDWGMPKGEEGAVNAPLQMLWFWALRSGVALADRMGRDDEAARWRLRADRLAESLRDRAWDDRAGSWRLFAREGSPPSRHANLLAVLSGLADEGQRDAIKRSLLGDRLPRVGTPFMLAMELTALARLGEAAAIPARVEAFWGAQLDAGATTFAETWNVAERGGSYAMYGRPFGNSLCHAWGSGPAAILPAEILGLRPLADGWRRFSVEPRLGGLSWASATVPTPRGEIRVEARRSASWIEIPAGTTAVYRGRDLAGPAKVSLEPVE